MADPTYNPDFPASVQLPQSAEKKTFLGGWLFGVPVKDLGLFATVLMGTATGFLAFFFATFLAIVFGLFVVTAGKKFDFSATYTYVGLPVGLLVLVLALAYLGMLWIRRQITRR
jgi:hypothetical protein